jgi:hypothetical protein
MELTDFLLEYLWIRVEAENPLILWNVIYTVTITDTDRKLYPILNLYKSVSLLFDGEIRVQSLDRI